MNYPETIQWLFSQLPMFHRIGAAAYKDNLDNILALSSILDNPQNGFRAVHVAGTNGKGSVCHLLASVLQEAGYKTGLFTSPHLIDFRERIRVNGRMIPEEKVTTFVSSTRQACSQIRPSFFELTTAMAFSHFRDEQVDIAVIETGMGGRLDSTNIITPLVSVITNISYDHTQFLGNTLEKIAAEKAGIIKPGIPVVIGETQPETAPLFISAAQFRDSDIWFADQFPDAGTVTATPLPGNYQQKNLKTVQTVLFVLQLAGLSISADAISTGIRQVLTNTGIRGRWEILNISPLTICDTGHNEAGIREVVQQLRQTPHQQLHMVFGMVSDKESAPVLELLPREAIYYFCKANIPRGLDAGELAELASAKGLHGRSYSSVRRALAAARRSASPDDLIFIGGSTFVVAEVLLPS